MSTQLIEAQNLIGCFCQTGGMAHHPGMKRIVLEASNLQQTVYLCQFPLRFPQLFLLMFLQVLLPFLYLGTA